MSTAGLQVFNDRGNLILDTSTRVFKKLGEFSCNPDSAKVFHDDRIKGKKIAWFLTKITVVTDGNNFANAFPVRMSVNNTTGDITWDYMNMGQIGDFVPPVTKYTTTYTYGWLS